MRQYDQGLPGENSPNRSGKAVPASERWVRRFFAGLIGGTVLLIGVAMILLPGLAVVVIPAGLAILASEYLWARRALRRCQGMVVGVKRQPWFRRFRRMAPGRFRFTLNPQVARSRARGSCPSTAFRLVCSCDLRRVTRQLVAEGLGWRAHQHG
jgi:Putative transmembrane protein (PGPGW)